MWLTPLSLVFSNTNNVSAAVALPGLTVRPLPQPAELELCSCLQREAEAFWLSSNQPRACCSPLLAAWIPVAPRRTRSLVQWLVTRRERVYSVT